MKDAVLVCRIAWMDLYRGVTATDRPVGGGLYVETMGFGHEAFNFAPFHGRYYGFVQPTGPNVNLKRLGAEHGTDKLKGVTIFWVATHPIERRTRVIGYFKNATVHASYQKSPTPKRSLPNGESAGFFMESREAVLLDRDERIHEIPRATETVRGMGQSNIWYPDSKHAAVLLRYLRELGQPPSKKRPAAKKRPRLVDTERRMKIERIAMQVTSDWFAEKKYSVVDVSAQCLGWDLEARRGKGCLLIEVKGTSLTPDNMTVEVTPNEYAQMNHERNQNQFRLCVVTNAEHSPELFVFAWSGEANGWTSRNGKYRLNVVEIVGARITLR